MVPEAQIYARNAEVEESLRRDWKGNDSIVLKHTANSRERVALTETRDLLGEIPPQERGLIQLKILLHRKEYWEALLEHGIPFNLATFARQRLQQTYEKLKSSQIAVT